MYTIYIVEYIHTYTMLSDSGNTTDARNQVPTII